MKIKIMWAAAVLVLCGLWSANARAAEVTIPMGPYVHFSLEEEVTIYWKTDTAVASQVEYGMRPNLTDLAEDSTPKTDHELTITGIKRETEYSYRILVGSNNTKTYWFFTAFDYGPGPFPAGPSPYAGDPLTTQYEQAATYILNEAGINRGVCIVYGCEEGQLAYELAKRSELKIIGFDSSAANVAVAREKLDQAGIYGQRVTVLQGSLSDLKCRDYSANLIVSDTMIKSGTYPGTATEMFRVLRPAGGMAFFGQPAGCPNPIDQTDLTDWLSGYSPAVTNDSNGLWARVDRAAIAGAGEWTHYYANPANTAASTENNISGSMKLLWYGQPGPRYVIDRHNRPMSSLSKNGLIVTPGHDGMSAVLRGGQGAPDVCFGRIMAYDAYNGTRFWDVNVFNAARVGILRDCGWMALADDYVYVASEKNCVGLDVATGRPTIHLTTTTPAGDADNLHWGYVAVVDDKIYGSGEEKTAYLLGPSRDQINTIYFDNQPIATSRYLFARNRTTGTELWTYKRGGGGSVIINPCIAVGGDYIYFIESRNSTAVNDSDGRVAASTLFSGSNEYLIKLNRTTGAEVDSQLLDLPFDHVAYLTYMENATVGGQTKNVLLASGCQSSGGYYYDHLLFNADTLNSEGSTGYLRGGSGGSHGEQDQHPVVVGNTIYMREHKVDVNSVSTSSFPLSRGNCGTQSGCTTHLFGRNFNGYMYALPGGGATRMTTETRVSCWINMIPAGGLLLVPDGGSGCTCDYHLQSTTVFVSN
jgi:hypothetical protein